MSNKGAADENKSPETLRVMTLNLWNKSGPWQTRMRVVREGLAAADPDIVGLQEVLRLETRSTGSPEVRREEQVDELRNGLHAVYGPAHLMRRDEGGGMSFELWFGNAILSRYPILTHQVFPLPGADVSDQTRSLLHARVDHPAGSIDVFVTHLNWKLDEGAVRVVQVERIIALINELAPADGRFPPLLMGDLNAEPNSDEIRTLKGLRSKPGERVRFADVWDYVGWREDAAPPPGFTFTPKNPFARIYHEPPRRIDYILVRGPLGDGRGRPTHVARCFDEPVDGTYASDHFGVTCDLVLNGTRS